MLFLPPVRTAIAAGEIPAQQGLWKSKRRSSVPRLMSGYTPVWSDIFDGTLCGKWPAAAVFATLLPLADKQGNIDLSMPAIVARTGWPRDLLEQGIRQLMEPDADSRTDACDGRRLVLIDENRRWGWRVVNHAHYREKARLLAKNAREVESGANAERKKQAAARRRSPPEAAGDRPANAEASPLMNTDSPEFLELKALYPRRSGSQPWASVLKAIRARLREGHTWAEILDGARRYAKHCDAKQITGTEFVMQAKRFCGPDKAFLEAFDAPAGAAATVDSMAESLGLSRKPEESDEAFARRVRNADTAARYPHLADQESRPASNGAHGGRQ